MIAAKAQVTLDGADVDRLISLTEFKKVKAPFEGTIVERDIDIGDLATAGSGSGISALYRVARDKPMRVFVNVPQSAWNDLLMGDAGRDHYGRRQSRGRHYDGRVSRTSQAIDPHSRTLRAEVDIPNADSRLVPGMYVEVSFPLKTPIKMPDSRRPHYLRPRKPRWRSLTTRMW